MARISLEYCCLLVASNETEKSALFEHSVYDVPAILEYVTDEDQWAWFTFATPSFQINRFWERKYLAKIVMPNVMLFIDKVPPIGSYLLSPLMQKSNPYTEHFIFNPHKNDILGNY